MIFFWIAITHLCRRGCDCSASRNDAGVSWASAATSCCPGQRRRPSWRWPCWGGQRRRVSCSAAGAMRWGRRCCRTGRCSRNGSGRGWRCCLTSWEIVSWGSAPKSSAGLLSDWSVSCCLWMVSTVLGSGVQLKDKFLFSDGRIILFKMS